MSMVVRAEWDYILWIGPPGRSLWSSWLASGAKETSGVISRVGRGSRLSKPSFLGETGGHPSRTLLIILRFLRTWPFWVCTTTDVGDLYCLITVRLRS